LPFKRSLNDRIDYFQTKCYRNILKIQVAFYSQVSNKEVLDRVSEILYQELGKTQRMSRKIADKATTLLGHIMRRDLNDHSRKVAIDAEFKRVERSKRRVGRPRFYWLNNTMTRAHKLLLKQRRWPKEEFDIKNAAQRKRVAEAAVNREHPFDKKRKQNKWKGGDAGHKNKHKANNAKQKQKQRRSNGGKQRQRNWRGDHKKTNADDKAWNERSEQDQERKEREKDKEKGEGNDRNKSRQPEVNRERRDLELLKRNTMAWHKTLNIEFTLDTNAAKKAYRKEAILKHPDKGGSKEEFQKLLDHYEKYTAAIQNFLRKFPAASGVRVH
jgi:hypothetical protein